MTSKKIKIKSFGSKHTYLLNLFIYRINLPHRARQKGVVFDVGHGQGSFDWKVAEGVCCSEQSSFWPDVISTDLHTGNVNGPVRCRLVFRQVFS